MKFSYFFFYLLFSLISFFCHGQKRYLFHHYTTRDGLINNGVFAINQDKYGYLWFATAAGVSRFDGYKFDNDVLPEINKNGAFSQCIVKDCNGNLVLTSLSQGLLIEQEGGKYKQFLQTKAGVGRNITRTVKSTKDQLIVSTGSTIAIFKDGQYKTIYECKCGAVACNTLECDQYNNIWFGGIYGLAVMFRSDTNYTAYFIPELQDIFVMSLFFINENELYVGTQNGFYTLRFSSFNEGKLAYTMDQPIPEMNNIYINDIYQDRSSNIWISTASQGVYKVRNKKIIENISVANGLSSYTVERTFQDQEGNYWFAMSNGINKIISFDNYGFTDEDDLISGVTVMERDHLGRVWAFNGQLYIINGTQITKIKLDNTSFSDIGIYDLHQSKNKSMLLVNSKGLYELILKDQNVKLQDAKLKADFNKTHFGEYNNIYEDDEGTILIGSDNGIFAYYNNRFSHCTIKYNDSSLLIRPFTILKDKYGYYWAGDYNNGLYRLKMKKSVENNINFDCTTIYKSKNRDSSFVTTYITKSIIDSQGNFWLPSITTGVYKLTLDSTGVTGYFLYSMKNGLADNFINEVIEDKDHNIWLSTNRGANCILSRKIGNDSILLFDSKYGLGDEVLKIFTTDSLVYISYAEGLYVINNSKFKKEENRPPPVLITSVNIMGIKDTTSLLNNTSLILPYNKNFISFEFASVSFNHENGILYQTKLEGLDREWSTYSDRRFISYNSLPPGKYEFKVKAMAKNGLACEKETTFTFKIIAPFYKTWWFITLIIIIISGSIYSLYQYRLKQMLKLERLRTRIASDLHDDVGSTLSSISILSELLSTQLDNNPKSVEMIEKIGFNARNMLESMDDIIWAVNPTNDKFQNLSLRIREYAIPLFESKDIDFRIIIPEQLALLHLPMEVRRNVYLITKEAINNLVKYSQCKNASIEFYQDHSIIILKVIDNGKGFNPEAETSRNGLKNMKRRAKQINAGLKIISKPDEGTKIELEVKII